MNACAWKRILAIALLLLPQASLGAFFLHGVHRAIDDVSYRVAGPGTTLESIMASNEGWIVQRERPYLPPPGALDVWTRFQLPVDDGARRLLSSSTAWDRVEFTFVADGKVLGKALAGTRVPLDQRNVRITMTSVMTAQFVALPATPGRSLTVYAHMISGEPLAPLGGLRFALWDYEAVLEGERRDRWIQGLFFGFILLLILYNLGLYALEARDPSYLYYSASQVFGLAMFAAFFGLLAEFVWPRTPWWDYYTVWLATPFAFACVVQFVRHYFVTAQNYPRAERVLKWMAPLMLVPVPILFGTLALGIELHARMQLVILVGAVGLVAVFWVTGLALARRHPMAGLFACALVFGGGGTALTFLPFFGLLPVSDWIMHGGQVGGAAMGLVLSLGLGVRVRRMREEQQRLRQAHEAEKRALVESQNRELEGKVVERTAQLTAAQEKADGLLANILPKAIIGELKEHGTSEPRRHDEVSILFTDFVGFTQTVSTIPPKRLVRELDEIFGIFDDITSEHGLEKIKTIGDAYMAGAGLPNEAPDHALRCVRAALALARAIEVRNQQSAIKWGLRVGVHSGAVVAGIVGKTKYAYDVWGDTVNVAARLETASAAGRVNISAYTYELVRSAFVCEYRGKLAVKGKGEIDMYFAIREVEPTAAGMASDAAR